MTDDEIAQAVGPPDQRVIVHLPLPDDDSLERLRAVN